MSALALVAFSTCSTYLPSRLSERIFTLFKLLLAAISITTLLPFLYTYCHLYAVCCLLFAVCCLAYYSNYLVIYRYSRFNIIWIQGGQAKVLQIVD
ncbi:MAG TPA: hypothetical protein DHV27_10805 [Psychrobacter sp.]|nr:hypothetical protein [Psychrobacter sp.]